MRAPSFSPSVEYPAAARRLGMALLLLLAYAWYARWITPLRLDAGPHVIIYSAGPDASR
jgi:hypothetical protein